MVIHYYQLSENAYIRLCVIFLLGTLNPSNSILKVRFSKLNRWGINSQIFGAADVEFVAVSLSLFPMEDKKLTNLKICKWF